jgi:hypothetical protein
VATVGCSSSKRARIDDAGGDRNGSKPSSSRKSGSLSPHVHTPVAHRTGRDRAFSLAEAASHGPKMVVEVSEAEITTDSTGRQHINEFTIEGFLGQGSFGKVLKARSSVDGKIYVRLDF